MIPTEPIGSLPRPPELIEAVEKDGADAPRLDALYEEAIRDTIDRFEATGSPVITDGEQRKYHNFWTYSVEGLANTAPDGFRIPFTAGHTRRMPRLTAGPFRYRRYADSYLDVAQRYARKPLKQAVIDLNNLALARFSPEERQRIGVHTCPGGDRDSTHSADVDYGRLLPLLFQLRVGNFYIALAGEPDRSRVLQIIRRYIKPEHRVFVGVVAPIDPRIETPEEVRDRVLEAAEHIPVDQLGTTDDCGFSPFSDDLSTSRETAFAKIRARVEGTSLAADALGVR